MEIGRPGDVMPSLLGAPVALESLERVVLVLRREKRVPDQRLTSSLYAK